MHPTETKRSTARRSERDRRCNERRAEIHGGLRILAPAPEALARERRTLLRRIEYRRGPLDRRAPYRRESNGSLQTTNARG